MANTIETTTIAVEDMQPGFRYWSVRPGFESNWTITSVSITRSENGGQVYRNGAWITPEIVTVTRRDGNVRHFEKGEQIAIQGPFKTED